MKKKKWSLWLIAGLLLTGFIYFIFLNVKIQQYAQAKPPANADYLIVLGAKVNGSVPSLALKYRIEAAAQYLRENRKTMAIVSGGMGPGENRTEADAMKEGLLNLGIDSARIMMEDQSTSTNENIRNSKFLLPKNAKAGIIVTNDFHLYRSIMIAKDHGLEVSGLAAKTPSVIILKSYIREYLALSNFFIQRNIQQPK
ncbi:YdcF family protein [Bacillus sp. SJS]|uniref:YdcF family protein n=1 Tax=Bacillus sp. SJS TaxID=1423321 RepID=UPI0004DD641F|nr:YdcF family protein [Bacillus sp. SJS]KZZ83069.1 cytoplasmic protein [Bacillus sp. SJS]